MKQKISSVFIVIMISLFIFTPAYASIAEEIIASQLSGEVKVSAASVAIITVVATVTGMTMLINLLKK